MTELPLSTPIIPSLGPYEWLVAHSNSTSCSIWYNRIPLRTPHVRFLLNTKGKGCGSKMCRLGMVTGHTTCIITVKFQFNSVVIHIIRRSCEDQSQDMREASPITCLYKRYKNGTIIAPDDGTFLFLPESNERGENPFHIYF